MAVVDVVDEIVEEVGVEIERMSADVVVGDNEKEDDIGEVLGDVEGSIGVDL